MSCCCNIQSSDVQTQIVINDLSVKHKTTHSGLYFFLIMIETIGSLSNSLTDMIDNVSQATITNNENEEKSLQPYMDEIHKLAKEDASDSGVQVKMQEQMTEYNNTHQKFTFLSDKLNNFLSRLRPTDSSLAQGQTTMLTASQPLVNMINVWMQVLASGPSA